MVSEVFRSSSFNCRRFVGQSGAAISIAAASHLSGQSTNQAFLWNPFTFGAHGNEGNRDRHALQLTIDASVDTGGGVIALLYGHKFLAERLFYDLMWNFT